MKLHHRQIRKVLFSLTSFGIAMGFLEAVVVVYLRLLFYPEGFSSPLRPMLSGFLLIESLREISTVVMIIVVSILAGSQSVRRFSFFLITFGVWDIFYYVWLKVLLNWPASLFDWDILFLIPVIWVGPVLAPVLCSGTMIVIGGYILVLINKGYAVRLKLSEWFLLGVGALLIFITFVQDYAHMIIKGRFYLRFWMLGSDPEFQRCFSSFVPISYNWPLFIAGEALIFSVMVSLGRSVKRHYCY